MPGIWAENLAKDFLNTIYREHPSCRNSIFLKPLNHIIMPDKKSTIRSFLSRSFEGQDFDDDDDIFDLGFANSLFAMQLVTYLEKEFGFEMESDDLDLDNFKSIEAMTSLVNRKTSVSATP